MLNNVEMFIDLIVAIVSTSYIVSTPNMEFIYTFFKCI